MATLKFFLRNKKSEKPVTIYIKILLPGKIDLIYSTLFKIEPHNWNFEKQEVKNKLEVALVRDEINMQLDKIREFINKTYIELTNKQDLSKTSLKYALDVFLGKITIEGEETLNFFQFVDRFVSQAEKRVTKTTIGTYRRTLQLLRDFEVETNYVINFETINITFYYQFMEYLGTLKHNANTKGKQIKNIKTFMNAAIEEGFTDCNGHKHKHFKVTKEDSFDIYLSINELQAIEKLKYKLDSTNDLVRDWFLIGAYTGQRVSDWNKLNKDSIIDVEDGIKCFKIRQTKTNNEVVIPIHPVIKRILNKRKGQFPKSIYEQFVNLHIKTVAKDAKIDKLIPQKHNLPKYRLVTTHTARRSFCTNAYKSGLDSLAIMQLSGHKTEKSFLIYIKIRKEEFAKRIANHEFFSK